MQRAVIAMKKTFTFAVAAALGLGGAIGAFALLVGKPADHGGAEARRFGASRLTVVARSASISAPRSVSAIAQRVWQTTRTSIA